MVIALDMLLILIFTEALPGKYYYPYFYMSKLNLREVKRPGQLER